MEPKAGRRRLGGNGGSVEARGPGPTARREPSCPSARRGWCGSGRVRASGSGGAPRRRFALGSLMRARVSHGTATVRGRWRTARQGAASSIRSRTALAVSRMSPGRRPGRCRGSERPHSAGVGEAREVSALTVPVAGRTGWTCEAVTAPLSAPAPRVGTRGCREGLGAGIGRAGSGQAGRARRLRHAQVAGALLRGGVPACEEGARCGRGRIARGPAPGGRPRDGRGGPRSGSWRRCSAAAVRGACTGVRQRCAPAVSAGACG